MFHVSSLIHKCQIRAFKQCEINLFYRFFLPSDVGRHRISFGNSAAMITESRNYNTLSDRVICTCAKTSTRMDMHKHMHTLHPGVSSNLPGVFLCACRQRFKW